jgi:calcium binding protein 39
VTKRQSLKLLGEILLDRANFNVMTKYIANEANLKMMMNLLRDKSKNIQFEAFHVFKVGSPPFLAENMSYSKFSPGFQVFVANPKKPPQIEIILRRNKEKLLNFLKTFHNDKEGAHAHFSFLVWIHHPSAVHIFPFFPTFAFFFQAPTHELSS